MLLLYLGTGCIKSTLATRWVKQSKVFSSGHTGFSLRAAPSGKVMAEHLGEHWFTPASNTKLLTWYTALHILGDSLPTVLLEQDKDTLWIFGTGNGAWMHPAFPQDTALLQFLSKYPGTLAYGEGHWQQARWGSGWAWDDMQEPYQPAMSALPIYGNLLKIQCQEGRVGMQPALFPVLLRPGATAEAGLDPVTGSYYCVCPDTTRSERSWLLPYPVTPSTVVQALAETLRRPLSLRAGRRPSPHAKAWKSMAADTVYRRMLHHSDNGLAEQVLLQCSWKLTDTLATALALPFASASLTASPSLDFQWVDGSGLSRYNQASPALFTALLSHLWREYPSEKLLDHLPAGGEGSLRGRYLLHPPYIWAKTGSLRHIHTLSGYLRTRRGHWLAFSFHHQGIDGNLADWKTEMEVILKKIYKKF